jgi:hypothetical protein
MQKFLVQIVKHGQGRRQVVERRYFDARLQAVQFTVEFNKNYDPDMFKYMPQAEFHGPVFVEEITTA